MRRFAESLSELSVDDWRNTLVEGSSDLTRAVSSLANKAADAVREEYRFTYEDLGLRIVRVQPNLLAVEYPRLNRISLLAARLNREYGEEYLVVNFSGQSYDSSELSGPVMDIAMPSCVPPLEVLLRLCLSAHKWLNTSSGRHALVVHGCDDKELSQEASFNRVVVFLACFASWSGGAPNAKEAMLEVCVALSVPDTILLPSQSRYLSYFEILQRGVAMDAEEEGGEKDLSKSIRVTRLVLDGMGGDGQQWQLQLWQQGSHKFKADFLDPDMMGSIFQVNATCNGDMCLRILSHPADTEGSMCTEAEICFHAAFLSEGCARFLGPDMDITGDSTIAKDWVVDVFFEPCESTADESERGAATMASIAMARAPPIREEHPEACVAGQGPVFTGSADGPVTFDISGDDEDDDEDFWMATKSNDVSGASKQGSTRTVFAPDDIDSFFNDI